MKENIYRLFQQILNLQTSLFFNRHIDQIILCCFYGVAKVCLNLHATIFIFILKLHFLKNSVKPFLVELGPVGAPPRIDGPPEVSNKDNGIPLTCLRIFHYLFCKATSNFYFIFDRKGQCPGSPKISQFPIVPDMSPKMVSPAHNIYVSPMRSSKV